MNRLYDNTQKTITMLRKQHELALQHKLSLSPSRLAIPDNSPETQWDNPNIYPIVSYRSELYKNNSNIQVEPFVKQTILLGNYLNAYFPDIKLIKHNGNYTTVSINRLDYDLVWESHEYTAIKLINSHTKKYIKIYNMGGRNNWCITDQDFINHLHELMKLEANVALDCWYTDVYVKIQAKNQMEYSICPKDKDITDKLNKLDQPELKTSISCISITGVPEFYELNTQTKLFNLVQSFKRICLCFGKQHVKQLQKITTFIAENCNDEPKNIIGNANNQGIITLVNGTIDFERGAFSCEQMFNRQAGDLLRRIGTKRISTREYQYLKYYLDNCKNIRTNTHYDKLTKNNLDDLILYDMYLAEEHKQAHSIKFNQVLDDVVNYNISHNIIATHIKQDQTYLNMFSQIWNIDFKLFESSYFDILPKAYQYFASNLYAKDYANRCNYLIEHGVYV